MRSSESQGSHTFFIFKFKDFSRTFQGLTGDFQGLINTKFQDFSRLNRCFSWHESLNLSGLSIYIYSTANIKALRGSLGALSVNKLSHIPKLQPISAVYENQ